MNKYERGKIYKLVNTIDDEIYVGSTIRKLNRRFSGHKCASKKNHNYKVYQHCDQVGWGNIKIELIENYPCESKKELLKRERYWADELNASLNQFKAYIAKDEVIKYRQQYYITHRSKNRQRRKAYKHEYHKKRKVCECGREVALCNYLRHQKSNIHKKLLKL